jgi:hypothetical protein
LPGTYVNQIDCILNCSNTASFGWNCCSGSCIPGTINNTGSYATLPECQSSCSRQYGWICTSEGCVTGSAGNTGSFSTLSACEDYCFYGWDCVSGNCITSSFGTTGSFPNEIICLLTCSVPYWNCDPIDGCYQVPFGTNTGSFTSFDSCSAACIPTPTSSITGYDCVSGNCVTASVGTTGSYATLASCSIYCTQSYGWNCDPTSFYCSPGTINNTGSYTTYESCSVVCAPPPPQSTYCPCNPTTNIISNGTFSNGSSGWIYNDPIINEYGITNWGFGNNSANIIILPSASSGVYLTQPNVFQISCSYNVCFEATLSSQTGGTIATINSSSNNLSLIDLIPGTTQAISAILTNINESDLTITFASDDNSNQSISIDNVCVTLISCPPTPEPSLDCSISGSGYSFSTGSLDCVCPEGYVSSSNGDCILSGSQSIIINSIATPTGSQIYYTQLPSGQTTNHLGGWSLNEPNSTLLPSGIAGTAYNILTNGSYLPPNAFSGNPTLYYDYNLNGSGNSSVNNPSPIAGNPNIYKTQYTFDILKNNIFYASPPLNPLYLANAFVTNQQVISPPNFSYGVTSNGITTPPIPTPNSPWDSWIMQRIRISLWNTQVSWSGFGTAINNTTALTKTYYVLIAAGRWWKIKLNGQTIVTTGINTAIAYADGITPVFSQQYYARVPNSPIYVYPCWPINGNSSTLPSPNFSYNPYITRFISGSWGYTGESGGWQLSAGYLNSSNSFPNARAQVYIYPIQIPAGQCSNVNFEVASGNTCANQYIGGVIFDNTAAEIANATSPDQLNIVFDSITLPVLNGQNPVNFSYLYNYPVSNEPSASQYITQCPSGSTPINGNACNGCFTTTSSLSIPCGDCVTCNHGVLYNGNVVDKGGYQLQGRGPGGIVNTGSVLNTWVIPTELDWNFLSTTLDNNFLPPSSNYEGALNTNSGGKLKDYSRDNNASCWGFPNAGAQTSTNASGWAGVAGGKRDNEGVFSDLGFNGEWWSANSLSTSPITNATLLATRELKHYSTDVYRNIRSKNYGFSIRLVRPALATETNGQLILDAYQGNDGIYYDGIVIGNRVWITKNLSETLYNNGSLINLEINPNTWSNSPSSNNPSPSNPYSCFYSNDSLNSSKVLGNLNPATGECYPKPSYYVYRSCFSGMYLFQSQIGNTTIPGEVQKDSNGNCWEFIEISEGFPNYPPSSIFGSFTTNYFASTPTVYNNCEECNAIHTLYLSFNTKSC